MMMMPLWRRRYYNIQFNAMTLYSEYNVTYTQYVHLPNGIAGAEFNQTTVRVINLILCISIVSNR